jgi:hypothetical protein
LGVLIHGNSMGHPVRGARFSVRSLCRCRAHGHAGISCCRYMQWSRKECSLWDRGASHRRLRLLAPPLRGYTMIRLMGPSP